MSLLNSAGTPMRYNNLGATGLMVSELSECARGSPAARDVLPSDLKQCSNAAN